MSSWLLLTAIVGLVEALEEDFLKEYISSQLDRSVSPCDDFYAHVCPYGLEDSDTVTSKVTQRYDEMIKTLTGPDPLLEDLRPRNLTIDLLDSCNGGGEEIVKKIAYSVISGLGADDFSSSFSCEEMASMVSQLRPVKLWQYIGFLKYGSLRMKFADSEYSKSLDSEAEYIFDTLKNTTGKLLIETPWLTNKNGTALYLKFLNKELRLFSITQPDILRGRMLWRFLIAEAMKCKEKFSLTNMTYTCLLSGIDFVGSGQRSQFLHLMKEVTMKTYHKLVGSSIFNAFNSEGLIVLGIPAKMMLNGKATTARNFGSLGSIIGHEIMHSFFHAGNSDPMQISKFWTNTSECVSQQYDSTCHMYLKDRCYSGKRMHLEEDGADLAGARMTFAAFKHIQKNLKEPSDIEGITAEQMLFYAFAAKDCHDGKTRYMRNVDDPHSQSYVRTNAVMAQMEEWREAFNCGADSRMLQSKTEHCSIYGSDAAQTFL